MPDVDDDNHWQQDDDGQARILTKYNDVAEME